MICKELLNLKMKDQFVKNELIYSMQCMIHQYAKTEKDIIRLEEMINLKTIMEERSPVLDSMKREGEKIGILKVLNDLEKTLIKILSKN